MIKNDQGFTLIELVVTIVLFGILITPAFALFSSGLKSWTHGTEQIDVVQNMRFAMDRMTMEIRQAVGEPAPNLPTSGTTASSIDFSIPKVEDGKFIAPVRVYYQYDATDKELERKEEPGSFQPVASRIKSVAFNYDEENYSLDITLVGIRRNGHEIIMTSNIVLRSVSR
ncbi:MAG: PilW family protein [Dehalobacterium sp.]|jgi:prepilin-type N-terminal cleavage/methylation domain-containing protein